MVGKALLLSLFGGVLFGGAVPPCLIAPLAWIGVAPLLISNAQPLRWEQRVLCALLWGITAAIAPIAMSIVIAKRQGAEYPNDFASWLVAFHPFLIAALVIGVVTVVGGKMWAMGKWSGWQWVLGIASLGIFAEWLSLRLPLPIHLALTQSLFSGLVSLAHFGGIWLVSWFVWFVNAAIAAMGLQRRLDAVSIGIVIAVMLFALTVSLPLVAKSQVKSFRVALVQNEMDDPLAMAQKIKGVELVVLPELSLGQETEAMWDVLSVTAKKVGVSLVAGFEETEPPANGAVLIAPNGRELLRYRKVHLFGGERWRYRRGKEVKVHEPFGVAICFDTAFPDVVRKLARQGAKVIAVPNFDPPVVGYLLHHLHAAFFPFRAVENGVAIVKADGTGLSQAFDVNGKCVAQAPLGQATVLYAKVSVRDYGQNNFQTPYNRLGDWFVALCAIILAALFPSPFLRR